MDFFLHLYHRYVHRCNVQGAGSIVLINHQILDANVKKLNGNRKGEFPFSSWDWKIGGGCSVDTKVLLFFYHRQAPREHCLV